MPRPKPAQEQRVVQFQVPAAGDDWVREEAARLGVSRSKIWRRLMVIGHANYDKENP